MKKVLLIIGEPRIGVETIKRWYRILQFTGIIDNVRVHILGDFISIVSFGKKNLTSFHLYFIIHICPQQIISNK